MKRNMSVVAIALGLVFLSTVPSASASREQTWSGYTSQGTAHDGYYVQFTVVTRNGKSFISDIFMEFLLTCSKTGAQFGFGSGFSGWNTPVVGGRFNFFFYGITDLDAMSGHIGNERAAGKLHGDLPALTSFAEWVPTDADLCASGGQTWTAYRIGGSRPALGAARQIQITHTRHADGTVSQTMRLSGEG